ncbi:hypothetical protein [Bacillus sp. T33-2]|uniref:hypothetical protein n=1 Tax=Bacillus sp. T33-2 TaxID=2054168 RepID=UPI000C78FDE3|nr:hypothetical protein [Bacillus sp. T33-2]PLR91098.1 hypothetical protein CVD19_22070 [Bacillus sp. T33-2]
MDKIPQDKQSLSIKKAMMDKIPQEQAKFVHQKALIDKIPRKQAKFVQHEGSKSPGWSSPLRAQQSANGL